MKSFELLLSTALSLAACEKPYTSSPLDQDDISAHQSQTVGKITGTIGHDQNVVNYSSKSNGGAIAEVEFMGQDGAMIASLQASSEMTPPRFQFGKVQWNRGDNLSPEMQNQIRTFAQDKRAQTIPIVAAYSYWKHPGQELKEQRLRIIQLYNEVAEFFPTEAKRFSQPEGTYIGNCLLNVCELYSEDAAFRCKTKGKEYDVTIFLDGIPDYCKEVISTSTGLSQKEQALHVPDECYGACGSGCGGNCRQIPVECVPPDVTCRNDNDRLTTVASPCFITGVVSEEGEPEQEESFTPSRNYIIPNDCAGTGPTQYHVQACTSARCCYEHDECNRHDALLPMDEFPDYISCQRYGVDDCGVEAAFGRPNLPWSIKWFNQNGFPLMGGHEAFGFCEWQVQCDGDVCAPQLFHFTPPSILSHTTYEQAPCLVHNCRHGAGEDCVDQGQHCDVGSCPEDNFCSDSSGFCVPCEFGDSSLECNEEASPDAGGSTDASGANEGIGEPTSSEVNESTCEPGGGT